MFFFCCRKQTMCLKKVKKLKLNLVVMGHVWAESATLYFLVCRFFKAQRTCFHQKVITWSTSTIKKIWLLNQMFSPISWTRYTHYCCCQWPWKSWNFGRKLQRGFQWSQWNSRQGLHDCWWQASWDWAVSWWWLQGTKQNLTKTLSQTKKPCSRLIYNS